MIYEKPDFHPDPIFYHNRKFPRKAFLEAAGETYSLLKDEVLKYVPVKDGRKTQLGFDNFLANMITAVNLDKPFLFSFDRNVYKSDRSLGIYHWGYQNMFNIYKAFEMLGLVDRVDGFFDMENDKGVRSNIYPSNSFISLTSPIFNSTATSTTEPILISEGKYLIPENQYAFETSQVDFPIEVRIGNPKKIVPFDKTTRTAIRMVKKLNLYNEMILGHQILIPIFNQQQSQPNFLDNINNTYITNNIYRNIISTTYTNTTLTTHTNHTQQHSTPYHIAESFYLTPIFYNNLDGRLTRKFNSTELTLGGRFYGAQYQNISKDLRPNLLLDGEETVELDYSGFHIRMLYHLDGIDFQDDPYSFVQGNDLLRKIYKIAALVIINADSFSNAIGGLKYELIRKSEKIFGQAITSNEQYNEVIKSLGLKDTAEILNTMRDKHEPIKDNFFRGKGIILQNLDSKIAEKVLMHFAKKDIPCLCIHDSFIVPKKHKDELESVMKESYFNLMNYIPKIK
ncbi:MAG: hypothetical protein K8F60_12755 [Melioribacteraceae bacterium]|nr:hypothetical protein [Melioribacteraceae bacterium]